MVSNPNVPTSTALQASILSSPRTFKRPCANSARCKAPLLSASKASKRLARSLGRSKSSISLWTCRSCTQQASSMISWLSMSVNVLFRVEKGLAWGPPILPGWPTGRALCWSESDQIAYHHRHLTAAYWATLNPQKSQNLDKWLGKSGDDHPKSMANSSKAPTWHCCFCFWRHRWGRPLEADAILQLDLINIY